MLPLSLLLLGLAAADTVTVHPTPSDEVLANPHLGWETFHRPATADRTLPAWLPSTVYYLRWGWREVEPAPDQLNTALLDSTLAAAKAAGQSLAFRVMCCSTSSPYQPDWLAGVGGKIVMATYDKHPFPVPDFDDPTTLERHLSLIKRLGERYDGHPDLDHVDLGSLGWWGEWHMSGGGPVKMPKSEHQRRVVDAYLQAFRRTPLVMLIGGGAQLTYACGQGAGWRADCLGDLGGFSKSWCHMCQGYPGWYRDARLADAWQRGPVAYESCWDMRKWVAEGWPLRYIFNYALATHATYLNNKSAPLPDSPEVRPEVERFLKRLGYRFVLREVRHPASVTAGGDLALTSVWQNTGSAPCYRPSQVAWRLGGTVLRTTETVRDWLPGSVELFTPEFLKSPPDLPDGERHTLPQRLPLPAELAPGEQELAVALVDPATGAPALRLALEGRGADGWYPVGRVRVTR